MIELRSRFLSAFGPGSIARSRTSPAACRPVMTPSSAVSPERTPKGGDTLGDTLGGGDTLRDGNPARRVATSSAGAICPTATSRSSPTSSGHRRPGRRVVLRCPRFLRKCPHDSSVCPRAASPRWKTRDRDGTPGTSEPPRSHHAGRPREPRAGSWDTWPLRRLTSTFDSTLRAQLPVDFVVGPWPAGSTGTGQFSAITRQSRFTRFYATTDTSLPYAVAFLAAAGRQRSNLERRPR